jgi:tetratricopeptide (TPR) repeat protein
VNDTKENHRLSFINFSKKYLPKFHIEIANAYLLADKGYEALEIFLKYAPSEEESINDCFICLIASARAVGDFSLEIEYSEKSIEFYLKNTNQVSSINHLAYTYKCVAEAYFSSGQTALAIDRLEKAIQGFKSAFELGMNPDKPYCCTVQTSYNKEITMCYNRLADIYRDIGNSEAADGALRNSLTDLITIDNSLGYDVLISNLATSGFLNLRREVFDQKVIDALLIVQPQVQQTNIFKCLNGHELQNIIQQGRAWMCDRCRSNHESHVPSWNCRCVQYGYDSCTTCIVKQVYDFNNHLFDGILENGTPL